MSLLHLVVPSKKVTVRQESKEHPKVELEVFGLTTEDLIYLYDSHKELLIAYFLKQSKKDIADSVQDAKLIMLQLPGLGADIIACGCKERLASDYVKELPLLTQIELLAAVLEQTMPEGLKKSLEKAGPIIKNLLKKK